ncbi:unnamed protein product [Tilletia controversa]|nr:unnamed protein product [Tilletia controversa]
MSFRFDWPEFGPDFHAHAAEMLNSALNKGPRPKVIADDIKVKELSMGTVPPELDILEIGDLTTDRFRGIFRLTYMGDAHLILSTKVQANPLSRPPAKPELSIFRSNTTSSAASASRGILFAASPLIVPMHLRLSHVRLRAIVVLVVSKSKGVTMVFKNDPLESVDVSSTFDGVAVIQKYLQQEIEGQLREMFREDLPGIIHRLSQSWLANTRDAAVGLGGMEPPARTYANQRAAQAKASPLAPRNSLPSHSDSHGHGQQRRREDQQDHHRLSSPSRMSVARSLSGVGMGIGSGAGLGVAVGLGSGAGGYHYHVGSGSGRGTPGQGTMHHRLAGAAAASVRSPSVAESVRSRGHMPRSVSASASASASSAAAAAARPRIYHVASRVQVPVLDDDDEARQLGFAGGAHRSGVSDGVASSSFDAPSSTRSSRTRAGQQQYLGGSRGTGTGTGTVRAPKSTRTGGAGTTGTRTIRAPPSLGSSRDLGMPRWGEDMTTTEEEEDDDRQATLRAPPPRLGAGNLRGALPSFDQQQQQQFAAAYWNGEVADEYEDDDDDLDLGRVSDFGQDDEDEDELDEVDELGVTYRSTGRTVGVHQRHTNPAAHTLEHEGSTLSPSDGTGSSVLSGSGTRTNDGTGTGTGTGTSSSEQANSLTTLEPTPMDPRSSEFKRQLYREQYRVQTDDGF